MVPPLEESIYIESSIVDMSDSTPDEEVGDERLDEFRESLGGPVREWGDLLTRDDNELDDEADDDLDTDR